MGTYFKVCCSSPEFDPTWQILEIHDSDVVSICDIQYNNCVVCVFDRMFIPEETTLIWTGAALPDELSNRPGVTLPRS